MALRDYGLRHVCRLAISLSFMAGPGVGCGDASTSGTGATGGHGTSTEGGSAGGDSGSGASQGGGTTVTTGGQGGSGTGEGGDGAGGSTSNGGSGGNGGGGPGGGGSGGVGGIGGGGPVMLGGDGAAACNAYCILGSCAGNVCTYGERLAAGAFESLAQPSMGMAISTVGLSVCRYGGYSIQLDVIATSSSCMLIAFSQVGGPGATLPFDAGALTFQGPTMGTVQLAPPNASGCQEPSPALDDVFSAGEIVSFTATGGADVLPFSLSAPAPEPLVLTLGPIQGGEPYVVTWAPPAPPTMLVLSGPNGKALYCAPEQPGSLVIPGAMTELLGVIDPDSIMIYANRLSSKAVSPGGAGLPALLELGTSYLQFVKYSP